MKCFPPGVQWTPGDSPARIETVPEGLTGSPDGLVGEDGMIEVKCPYNGANHLKHCFITNDETFLSEQPEYYYQMQCYMLLSGRKWCDFVSFDPRIISDLGLFIYRVNANEEIHDKMTEKVKLARELFNQYFESFNGKKSWKQLKNQKTNGMK